MRVKKSRFSVAKDILDVLLSRGPKSMKAGCENTPAFLRVETCGFGQRHFYRLDGPRNPHVSLYNRDGRFYQPNHFSMSEKYEMKYVPVGLEARAGRSCGLRLILERLLLRLLRHSCMCPFCFRLRENEAVEKVIEF